MEANQTPGDHGYSEHEDVRCPWWIGSGVSCVHSWGLPARGCSDFMSQVGKPRLLEAYAFCQTELGSQLRMLGCSLHHPDDRFEV